MKPAKFLSWNISPSKGSRTYAVAATAVSYGIRAPCVTAIVIRHSRLIRQRTCGSTLASTKAAMSSISYALCATPPLVTHCVCLEETGLYRGVYLPGANSALFQPEYPAKNKAHYVCAGEKENQPVGELSSIGRSSAENKSPGRFEIKKVIKLTHPALVDYLQSRHISIDLARQYLKEVHFRPNDQNKSFFALGWKCGGGYDVRNRHFKGFVGLGKDISTINLRKGEAIYIFEGWMDFLSYLTLHELTDFKNAALILHSTALRKRAVELIKDQTAYQTRKPLPR